MRQIKIEMITHEEARNLLINMKLSKEKLLLFDYITEQQAKDKVHEELVRDVKRFMEIFNISDNSTLWEEHNKLVDKLSKVGKKE